MEQQPEIKPEVWKCATDLYKVIWRYYMLQIESITRENYVQMKEIIGYPETYDEHMTTSIEGIPHDSRLMVTHIANFLNQYVEFQQSKYIDKIQDLIESIEKDREVYKRKAFEILVQQNANVERPTKYERHSHPPLFELQTGDDDHKIVLPTYGNPMMTSLYATLFQCFCFFNQTEETRPEEYTEVSGYF